MNYFEFRQQLLQDSYTKDEEFHRLRKQDLRCAKAYEEAMAFEKILKKALEIKTPDNLKDLIILRQTTSHNAFSDLRKYAIAASLFFSLLIISTISYLDTNKSSSVENFIKHSMLTENDISISKQPISLHKINEVFAEFKTQLAADMGDVHFIHNCHTPGGTGVHMVVTTENGPITIYYMPNTTIGKQRINFDTNKGKAMLVALERGSAAIIADNIHQIASIEPLLKQKLFFL